MRSLSFDSMCRHRTLAVMLLNLAWALAALGQTLTTPLWQDGFVNSFGWSTGESVNAPAFTGNASMKIGLGVSDGFSTDTYVFARVSRLNTVPYRNIEFYINGGDQGGQAYRLVGLKTTASVDSISGVAQITPYLFDLNDQPINAVPAGAWAKVKVPLSAIGFAGGEMFFGIALVGSDSINPQLTSAQPTAFIDEVRLTGPAPSGSATVSVDLTKFMAVPFSSMLPGVNLAGWALDADTPNIAGSNNLMADAGLKSFRAHLSNAAGNYDVGAWDFTADDNQVNSIATFGNIIAGVPGARAFISYNQWMGSPQQAAALLSYCNVSTTDPAYVNDVPIGFATEYYLENPAIGGVTNPIFSTRSRDWKSVRFWVDLRRAAPLETDDGFNHLRVAKDQPWRFTYWELGNEPAGSSNPSDEHVPLQHDAENVALRFVADWNLMKSIDPSIKLGICTVPDNVSGGIARVAVDNPATQEVEAYTGWTPVLLRTLRDQGILPDWFSDHLYFSATVDAEALTGSLMNGDLNLANRASIYRQMIDDYFGNFTAAARSGVELHATEINNPIDDYRSTTSLTSGLLLADTMGHIMQTEYRSHLWFTWKSGIANVAASSDPFAASSGWRDYGDWGMIGSTSAQERVSYFSGVKFPTFFASKLIKRFVQAGDQAVRSDGIISNNIYLSTYAVKKPNGDVSLLIINKSSATTIQTTLAFNGFVPGATATLCRYGQSQDNAQQSDTASTGTTVDLAESTAFKTTENWSLSVPPFSMTVVELHPNQVEQWRVSNFTSEELALPGISGDTAVPAYDGMSNLIKFALGLQPKVNGSGGAPVRTLISIAGKQYLAITFQRRIGAVDVAYDVVMSTDLQSWDAGGILVGVPADNLDGTETVTFRDTVSIDSVSQRFIRLSVRRL